MIKLINITKKYGDTYALKSVNITFKTGKINVVLGPSGAGKTTLLRIIAGLEKPDTGRVLIDGRDVSLLPPWERGVALVFQESALFPHMNVYENIAFGLEVLEYSREEIREKVEYAAKLLRISHLLDKYPEQLSGGEAKRVVLARALVVKPRILLLDEPFSNLDLLLREELRLELKRLQRETGITFIHVTHDLDEALELADYIVLINHGEVIEQGEPLKIYMYPSRLEAAVFWKHNIISIADLVKVLGKTSIREGFGTDKCMVVIPAFMFRIRDGDKCIIKNKLYRRNYVVLLVECDNVLLEVASTYIDSEKYDIGSSVGIELVSKNIDQYSIICR